MCELGRKQMMIISLYNNASLQTMMFRFKTSKMPPC